MYKYKSILFDVDGTIVDSAPGILESLKFTFEKLKVYNIDDLECRKFLGPPLKQSFTEICGFHEDEAEKAVKFFRDYYSNKGLYGVELYSGIKELLELLHEDCDLFVATSKPTIYTEKIFAHLGIQHYFKDIVGSNLDNSRSKKQEVIQYVLEKNCITDRSNVLMIGDKSQDIIGAHQCGIDAIGVLYGYGSYEELKNAGSIKILENPNEIIAFLQGEIK